MTWTNERIGELTKLWEQGLSASEIGKALGVSKNAVVGKAHRLNLPARPSPIKRGGSSKPRSGKPTLVTPKLNTSKMSATAMHCRPAKPLIEEEEKAERRSPVLNRRASRAASGSSECLWPIGDPGDADFHFCGEPSVSGKPYCAEHCSKAYITKSRSSSSETEAA